MRSRWPTLVLALIVASTLIRVGDAQFINDEPDLIRLASACNHLPCRFLGISFPFTPAPVGLRGIRGTFYGPLPTWIYQIFLVFTHDPVVMITIHALLFAGATAIGLAWLARSLRVTEWLAVVTMLSPWVWLSSRQLWDSNFCIPLCTLTLAAYGDFLWTRRRWTLVLTVACAAAMLLVHFMALALVAALAIHLLCFQTRWFFRFKWTLLTAVVVLGAIAYPYACNAIASYEPEAIADQSAWKGWVFPLEMGAHHLAGTGPNFPLGPGLIDRRGGIDARMIATAQIISLLAYPAVWTGMILAAIRALRIFRRSDQSTPIDHLALLALGIFVCQCFLDGALRVYGSSHYLAATWIAYVIFAWLAVDALFARFRKNATVVALLPIHATALVVVLIGIVYQIAHDGGTIGTEYGTSIANQIAAIGEMRHFSDNSPQRIEFWEWKDYPRQLPLLLSLYPPAAADQPVRQLIVRQRDAFPGDAGIAVEALPPQP
jgi:hypothetical protein